MCEALKAQIDIQIVTFLQSGLVTRPGTANLMESALADGTNGLGGIADIEGRRVCVRIRLSERLGPG